MRPESPLLRSEVSTRARNSPASQPCSSVSGKSFMFIIVWDWGGKPVSVLGFRSPIRPLQARTGPCWKEVSPPPAKEEGPSRLWSVHCACWIPGCQSHGELWGCLACRLFC